MKTAFQLTNRWSGNALSEFVLVIAAGIYQFNFTNDDIDVRHDNTIIPYNDLSPTLKHDVAAR